MRPQLIEAATIRKDTEAKIQADQQATQQEQARAAAARAARQAAAPATPALPKYQPQVATIGTVSDKCPPGSSPARQANGQYVTVPPTAYCVKDAQANAKGAGSGGASGAAGAEGGTSFVVQPGSADKVAAPKEKKIEWGPIKLEAITICNQSPKNSKWQCYGPLQNEPFHDGATLESALSGQHCAGGTWAAGGPLLDGVQWQAYRCGHSLGVGDYDVAKRYSLVTARRSYMCPKYEPSDGRCSTIYDGQDKR